MDASFVIAATNVRNALDRRVERFVFGVEVPPDTARTAVRHVRIGNYLKVRLLHLLKLSDNGTATNPLAGFTMQNRQALLSQSLQVVLQIVTFTLPSHAMLASQFFNTLTKRLCEALSAGVSLGDVSEFYRSTMAKCVLPVLAYALGEHDSSAPRFELGLLDEASESRRKFDRAFSRADARNEARGTHAVGGGADDEDDAPSAKKRKAEGRKEKKNEY